MITEKTDLLNTLEQRYEHTEKIVRGIFGSGEDSPSISPDMVANMILQIVLNQMTLLRSVSFLLEEAPEKEEKKEDGHA